MKAIPKIKLGKEYQASVNYEVKKQVLHMADMTGAHFSLKQGSRGTASRPIQDAISTKNLNGFSD